MRGWSATVGSWELLSGTAWRVSLDWPALPPTTEPDEVPSITSTPGAIVVDPVLGTCDGAVVVAAAQASDTPIARLAWLAERCLAPETLDLRRHRVVRTGPATIDVVERAVFDGSTVVVDTNSGGCEVRSPWTPAPIKQLPGPRGFSPLALD